MTKEDFARELGISYQTRRVQERRGMPTDSLAKARAWREANLQKGRGGRRIKGGGTTPPLTPPAAPAAEDAGVTKEMTVVSATARLRLAQAEVAELEAAAKRGELRPLADYQRATTEAMVILATQLDGVPGRLASQLSTMDDAGEIRQVLMDEARRIRSAIADRLRDWALLAGSGTDPGAAATAHC